ncbi:hypothetical protein COCSUDRAFT_34539 [Coccomyxa subellipsoidea C-169]|uniref:Uncharacterized protein n=1 Tax=Coccomyxa subellipsoidea (strain C-169) TaxID=574566 RepID=I0YIX2_COCSC|nr:hypothetical protein COCSUDRAFT_34539 [Coccomyxa subellipsoidea C-169]EIE18341.1 hypothetical protein COCSUDRAFT_34539 [Coccomyxa subellipsoidea C-169]|eukprot:XP_005642885.1 hypothetical protein COCSUDRAFT_34539 [Coccomyxa subellipsoidea C-169]
MASRYLSLKNLNSTSATPRLGGKRSLSTFQEHNLIQITTALAIALQVCLLVQKTRTTLIIKLNYHQALCNLQTGTHFIFMCHLENAT